jgi:hypothetical protein
MPRPTKTVKRDKLLLRLSICFIGNVALLLMLFTLIYGFAEESTYFRFGPRDDFSIVGVKINTWTRYACLHGVLLVTQTVDMLVSEFANPILGFNIYNPDKDIITDFTHLELQFFAQSMWLINGIRAALMVLVTISQLDIAIAKVIYTEFTGLFTVYFLLSEKEFVLGGGEAGESASDALMGSV